MNRKAIKSVLQRKHNDLINSIDDPVVKELIDKNSIITGGAIASMLLNEPVNDYDYYFTNKETALAVANYYSNLFNDLMNYNTEVVEENNRVKIKVNYEEMTEQISELEEVEDGEALENTLTENKDDKYKPIFISENAITLSNKIQIVLRFYGSPEEIHSNYDFVHTTNYWTSKDKQLYLNKEALESLLSKHLIYKGSKYPLCSIIRTRKFIKRGWHINAGQYVKMALQLNEMDLFNIDTLRDQLVGVDALYFMKVIDKIKEKQNNDLDFKLDTSYLIKIIDKIF